ncbi:MAG: C40 family peptidase [Brumimicrobium sp.]|nr:C40 family peptidase [Brumimicrobium sp.]
MTLIVGISYSQSQLPSYQIDDKENPLMYSLPSNADTINPFELLAPIQAIDNDTNQLDCSLEELKEEQIREENYQFKIDDILNAGMTYLGKPYRYPLKNGQILDCSGLLYQIHGEFNVQLPRTSRDMAQYVQIIPTEEAKEGDLMFFKGRKGDRIGHVSMIVCVENDTITMLHSSSSRGVIVEKFNENTYFKKRFVSIGRIPADLYVQTPVSVEEKEEDYR